MWHHVFLIGKRRAWGCVREREREIKSKMVNEEAITLLISGGGGFYSGWTWLTAFQVLIILLKIWRKGLHPLIDLNGPLNVFHVMWSFSLEINEKIFCGFVQLHLKLLFFNLKVKFFSEEPSLVFQGWSRLVLNIICCSKPHLSKT